MRSPTADIAATIRRWQRFLRYDIWQIGRPGEEAPDGFVIQQIRVGILLAQNFIENKLFLRAAALTFVSLLSIVPSLALMWFAIDKFNLGEVLYEFVETNTAWIEVDGELQAVDSTQTAEGAESAATAETAAASEPVPDRDEEVWSNLISMVFRDFGEIESDEGIKDPIQTITELARGSGRREDNNALGVAGAIFVLGTVIGLIRNIESAFNSIWGLKNTRSWYRMFSDYVMVIVLLPVVVVFAITVTSIIEGGELGGDRFGFLLFGAQYGLIWLGFTALYFVVPNTSVKIRYAFLSGIVAGTLWCLMSFVYVKLQFGLGRFDPFYSGFSAIPLLIMWIYFSWIILLFGAELAYAYQNEKTFAMERWAAGTSYAYREALAVRAMMEIARRFDSGEPGMPATQSAEDWHVPTRLLNETLEQLEEAGLVTACATEPVTYVPARSLEKISASEIIDAIREAGRDPSDLRAEPDLQPLLAHARGDDDQTLHEPLTEWLRRINPPKRILPSGDTDHNILQLNDRSKSDDPDSKKDR